MGDGPIVGVARLYAVESDLKSLGNAVGVAFTSL
jgi:hypothetical protein